MPKLLLPGRHDHADTHDTTDPAQDCRGNNCFGLRTAAPGACGRPGGAPACLGQRRNPDAASATMEWDLINPLAARDF